MTRITTGLATTLATAVPALAHPGAHVHPHAESALPVLLGLAVIAFAALALWRA
jgi:uncharacterized RmlC-like cupin family protein